MFCTKHTSSYKSSDGTHDIIYSVYQPLGAVRGVVQIAHGMCEYFGRYEDFAHFLVKHGYVVCGNDHLGHGRSVSESSELGYFAEENGWEYVVKDMHNLTRLMKKGYSDIPYFLFGHSMGSFMSRAYCIRYSRELDGAIFCGTSGGIEGIPALLTIIDCFKKVYGSKHRSNKVNKIAFGAYNKQITDSDSSYAWLTRDKAVVEEYVNDDKCAYIFTLNGFENLMKVLWYVSNDKWFETYNKSLPTLLIAGDADPVGDYGKGVEEVYEKLCENDCKVDMKLYHDARHEILNELEKEKTYADVLEFLNECVSEYKKV